MLKRYMHKRERRLAMLNDNRVVRPFEWGLEFIGEDPDSNDPHQLFSAFSSKVIKKSDEYFAIPARFEYRLQAADFSDPAAAAAGTDKSDAGTDGSDRLKPRLQTLTWTSAIATPSPENNTAYAT